MRVLWAVVFLFWAGAGWAEDVIVTQDGNTTHFTTLGNLAPTQNPGCVSTGLRLRDFSPPDLFLGVIDCLGKGRGESAAQLYILMRARANFDTRRVTDRSAHDAGSVLAFQLGRTLLPEKLELLQTQLTRILDRDGGAFLDLCLKLIILGTPEHSPDYMIAHGIKAITGDGGPALVEPFDAEAAWNAVLRDDMHCPLP